MGLVLRKKRNTVIKIKHFSSAGRQNIRDYSEEVEVFVTDHLFSLNWCVIEASPLKKYCHRAKTNLTSLSMHGFLLYTWPEQIFGVEFVLFRLLFSIFRSSYCSLPWLSRVRTAKK